MPQPLVAAAARPPCRCAGKGRRSWTTRGATRRRSGEGRAAASPTRCATASSVACRRWRRAACAATRGDADLRPATRRPSTSSPSSTARRPRRWRAKDLEGYQEGARRLGRAARVAADPPRQDPVPTFSEGRHLFRSSTARAATSSTASLGPQHRPRARQRDGQGLAGVDPHVDPLPARLARQDAHAEPLAEAARSGRQSAPSRPGSPEYAKWKATMRERDGRRSPRTSSSGATSPSTRPGRLGDAQRRSRTQVAGYADVPGATAEKGKADLRVVRLPGLPRDDRRRTCPSRGRAASVTSRRPSPTWAPRRRPTGSRTGSRTRPATGTGRRCRTSGSPGARPRASAKYIASLKGEAARRRRGRRGGRGHRDGPGQAQRARPLRQRGRPADDAASSAARSSSGTTAASAATDRRLREVGPHRARARRLRQEGHHHPRLRLRDPRPPPPDDGDVRHPEARLAAHLPPRSHRAADGRLRPLPARDPVARRLPQGPHRRQAAQRLRARAARPSTPPRSKAGKSSTTTTAAPATSSRSTAPTSTRERQDQLAARRAGRAPPASAARACACSPSGSSRFLRDPGEERHPPVAPPRVGLRRGRACPTTSSRCACPRSTSTRSRSRPSSGTSLPGTGRSTRTRPPRRTTSPRRRSAYALTHMMSSEAGELHLLPLPGRRSRSSAARASSARWRRTSTTWPAASAPSGCAPGCSGPANWLPYTKMTAFWATTDRPKDAAAGPGAGSRSSPRPRRGTWPPRPRGVTGEKQAEMVRDFLFGLPPDAVFPATVADVADSPLVKKLSPEQLKADAAPTRTRRTRTRRRTTRRGRGRAHGPERRPRPVLT